MLRKTLLPCAALFLTGAVLAQTSLKVGDIIAKNLEARGGQDRIAAVKSARFSGRMTMGQGLETPIVLTWQRPNKVRSEFTFEGKTAIQAFDGKSGWAVMPFRGSDAPEPMTADDLEQVQETADLSEGPLFEYAAKGHQVELLGKEDIEGAPAYKLKVTKKNGDVTTTFLDAETYLETKTETKNDRSGQEMEIETSFDDYRKVAGLLFPHSVAARPKGAHAGQTVTIDKIELDIDLPDSYFTMPEVPREGTKPAN